MAHLNIPGLCTNTLPLLRSDFKVQLTVDRQLPLFRPIETGRNRTEPPVNRRLSFEVIPYTAENG